MMGTNDSYVSPRILVPHWNINLKLLLNYVKLTNSRGGGGGDVERRAAHCVSSRHPFEAFLTMEVNSSENAMRNKGGGQPTAERDSIYTCNGRLWKRAGL